ncbi:MAG TPA: Piwi domain-containing protein [Blastocatellia bacterium]|jgi:hypothetical protein
MSRRLILNLAPIRFDDAEVQAGIFTYESKEQLKALRAQHNSTHIFRRDGDQIICVPVIAGAAEIGDSQQTIKLKSNLYLSATLMRNALLNYLHGIGRQILDYCPIEFIANGSGEDLLASSLPPDVIRPTWLSVRPLFEADVRVINLDRQPSLVALVLNVRTKRNISLPCDELIADSFPIVGCYVGHNLPSGDKRVEPHFQTVGRVEGVSGGKLVLNDAREGFSSINASDAILSSSWEAFDRCLAHVFSEQTPDIKRRLDAQLTAFRTGPNRLEKLRKVIKYFGGLGLKMIPGVSFTIESFLSEGANAIFPRVQEAPRTIYVFDPTGKQTNTWHDKGLDDYGPYTAQTFTPSIPRVCVICQAEHKGQVEQFLYKFLYGVNYQGKNRAPFLNGLAGKYKLDDVSLEFFTSEDDSAHAYQKAVRQALAKQRDEDIRWSLALVQIDERFHALYGEDNPYLVTKMAFLSHQIPVQEFEIETALLPDYQVGYVLNNMALATYAKLGGVPWMIKADPTIAHELVIGLCSASIGEGRLGKRERIVGITTVFTGDGNYWLSNLSEAVPLDDYKEALLASLEATVTNVRRDMNWQKREHLRLVFHSFKPFKDIEAEAVKEVVSGLTDYDVDLAFLHVAEDHPYLLFDEMQKGVRDFKTKAVKGVLGPNRGQFFRLSKNEVLITLTGASEVKRPEDGLPRPILLRLHRNSTFDDTTYLARQVFAFSCHSWRSFFPSPMPVTVLYSELIAKLLGQLAPLPQWNADVMLGRIGKTRWFL